MCCLTSVERPLLEMAPKLPEMVVLGCGEERLHLQCQTKCWDVPFTVICPVPSFSL